MTHQSVFFRVRAASHQRGASLITAIFLLVVLATLAVAMVSLSTTQQASTALDVQGSRAYLAARAGAEWGVYQVTRTALVCPTGTPSITTFAMPAGSTLSPFSVTVQCLRVANANPALVRHQVTATACNQPGPACPNPSNSGDYVQRIVTVEF